MTHTLDDFIALMQLEAIEVDLFRGHSLDLGFRQMFGGQVISQALAAACETVEGRQVHSLHGYFLRPGDAKLPVVYHVERTRDGGSFSSRRVIAIQKGQPLLTLSTSFQIEQEGLEHQSQAPQVPPPEELQDDQQRVAELCKDAPPSLLRLVQRERPLEFRSVQLTNPLHPEKREPVRHIWFRFRGQLPEQPLLHRYLLAYASDFNLLTTALLPHGVSLWNPNIQVVSLDHALWFHRQPDLNDWLLYSTDSPWTGGGRGLARGQVFDRQGRLVASVAQEGLMRERDRTAK